MTMRLACVLFVVGACGSKAKPPPPPPVVKSEAPPFTGKPVDAPTVTLIEPGGEPRVALRYKPVYGARSRIDADMKMDTSMSAGGRSFSIQPPTMKMVMESLITDAGTSSFDVALKLVATDIGQDGNPALATGVKDALAKIVGMTVLDRLDHRGVVLAADTVMPAAASPEAKKMMGSMDQMVTQATAPFPEEAVGVGAKWRVMSTVETNGMKLTQNAVYELVDLKGNRGRVTIDMTQTAPEQDFRSPDMAPDMTAHLESVDGHGRSTMTFDLAEVMPASLVMDIDLDIAMTMTQGGTDMPFAMQMAVDVEMTSTPLGR